MKIMTGCKSARETIVVVKASYPWTYFIVLVHVLQKEATKPQHAQIN